MGAGCLRGRDGVHRTAVVGRQDGQRPGGTTGERDERFPRYPVAGLRGQHGRGPAQRPQVRRGKIVHTRPLEGKLWGGS